MKLSKNVLFSLLALVTMAALYRLIPNRPYGFAPQIAMALFGGSLFANNKKIAFLLPIVSMFLSDCLFQILYNTGNSTFSGFYSGQWENYLLFAGLTIIGFAVSSNKWYSVFAASIAGPTIYFIVSNFLVWMQGGGWQHPKTFAGMIACYTDAVPFYTGSLLGTMVFSAILFGGYNLVLQNNKKQIA